MATPVIETTNTSTVPTTRTDHTASLPASIASGDLIVIKTVHSSTTVGFSGTLTTEYTRINVGTFASERVDIWWKEATGAEGTTVAWTCDESVRSAHTSYRISGWESTLPPEVSTIATGTGTAPDSGSLTVSWGADTNLWLWGCGTDLGTNSSISALPSGYANLLSAESSSGLGGCSTYSGDKASSLATEDPGTATLDASDDWAAWVLGVAPSGAGGGPAGPVAQVITTGV